LLISNASVDHHKLTDRPLLGPQQPELRVV
jgi:hypothetical protein